MTGLLIAGQFVATPGVTVIPPASHGGRAWCRLDPGDFRARHTTWIRQIVLHTTKGIHPQRVVPGAGAPGRAQIVADFWRRDAAHSAAHIVVDLDGTVACLADLQRVEAYHAEGSNPWSVGIEMYQLGDGTLYEATLDATVALVRALCNHLLIPEQMPDRYHGEPLMRMEFGAGAQRRNLGGPNCVGVFGHRHNTGNRGRGDPGDEIFARLARAGFDTIDYDREQDLELGKMRQRALNTRGEKLVMDGMVGPSSIAAARRQGFQRWRDVV